MFASALHQPLNTSFLELFSVDHSVVDSFVKNYNNCFCLFRCKNTVYCRRMFFFDVYDLFSHFFAILKHSVLPETFNKFAIMFSALSGEVVECAC